jgi:hypothetical protein
MRYRAGEICIVVRGYGLAAPLGRVDVLEPDSGRPWRTSTISIVGDRIGGASVA